VGRSGGIPTLARAVTLATGLLIGAGLDVAFFGARTEGVYWNVVEWTTIAVPLVVVLSIPKAPLPGWVWPSAERGSKLRISVILWLLIGIILPWILAWLMADAAGGWFTSWWAEAHKGGMPGIYLWAIWLLAGTITYTVASAIGVLITFLVDETLASRPGADST
jgi:hypothetical protein